MDIVVIIMGAIALAAGIGGFVMEHSGSKKDKESESKEEQQAEG